MVLISVSDMSVTSAAGSCPRPGAVRLAESDVGSLEVESRLASHTARRIEVVVAHILDKKAVFWGRQCGAVHDWAKRRDKKRGNTFTAMWSESLTLGNNRKVKHSGKIQVVKHQSCVCRGTERNFGLMNIVEFR